MSIRQPAHAVAVADLAHNVLTEDYETLSYGHRAADGIPRCEAAVRKVFEMVGKPRADLIGVCVGLPGPVVATTGRLSSPTILPGWAEVDVAAALHDALHVPVVVDNDAKLGRSPKACGGADVASRTSPISRCRPASAPGSCSTVTSTAAPRDGRRDRHTTIEENGPVCRCGNRGCLEVLAGVPALLDLLRRSHGEDFSIEDMLRGSAAGDVGCRRVISDAGCHIGVAVANLCNLLSLQRIIIGGELALAGDLLISAITDSMSRRAISISAQHTEVTVSTLGGRAGVLGAVARALQEGDRYVTLPFEPTRRLR